MKKKILMLLVLIVSIFTVQVNAKQFYANDKIKINEQQDYSVFAAGQEIDISSFIDGSTFVAGEDITITSSQDIIFAAGEDIKIKDAYAKDVFVAGMELEITNSQIRDLFAFAEDIEINSEISHNAYLGATKVVIDSKIMGNVYIAAEEIIIKDGAEIMGTLEYPETAYIRISDDAIIENTKEFNVNEPDMGTSIQVMITDFINSYLTILVTGIAFIILFRKQFDKLEKEELSFENVAKKVGLGFLLLIAAPIVALILMFSIVGVPLSFMLLALYIMLIYISIIPSGYFIAYKLLHKNIKNDYLLLAIGILGIKLLEFVPVIGFLVALISLCFGMWVPIAINKKKTVKEK